MRFYRLGVKHAVAIVEVIYGQCSGSNIRIPLQRTLLRMLEPEEHWQNIILVRLSDLTFARRNRGGTVANVKSTVPGSVAVQERVEGEWSLGTSTSGRRRIGSIAGIEHARLARLIGLGIALDGRGRLRRRGRRQIERPLASAATERKRGRAQHNKSPSLIFWAVVASHVKIPNAAAPYKD